VIRVKTTLREKRLAKNENGTESNDSQRESEGKHDGSGILSREPKEQAKEGALEVNMIFVIPTEFRAPISEVAELAARAELAIFEKPARPGQHMKPLYI
jgi:hypothetical protein